MVKHAVSPDQNALWTSQEIEFVTASDPVDGAAVSLDDRARYLGELMTAYNLDNRAIGLQHIAGSQQRARLDDQYHGHQNVTKVVEGAIRKVHAREQEEKTLFAKATGMFALVEAGFNIDDVTAMTRDMYKGFISKYGPGNAKAADRSIAMSPIKGVARSSHFRPQKRKHVA